MQSLAESASAEVFGVARILETKGLLLTIPSASSQVEILALASGRLSHPRLEANLKTIVIWPEFTIAAGKRVNKSSAGAGRVPFRGTATNPSSLHSGDDVS